MSSVRPQGPVGSDIILVCDDDPDSRAMLHAALSSAGLTPVLATDGQHGLALLGSVTPDLILMDAVMPPPDGFETCRRIKAQSEFAHIPVIFMTGLSDTDHVVAGLQAGGVDYLPKPLVLDELIARIQVHLHNARLTHSALTALDAAGRKLIATDDQGAIRWSTPHAAALIARIGEESAIMSAAANMIRTLRPGGQDRPRISFMINDCSFELTYVGQSGTSEYFFRLSEAIAGGEVSILQHSLGLTPREADVLLWIARGKSNRDTSEILNISARTVNKHLEQIFIKLGVENRAAAASIATRIIATQG